MKETSGKFPICSPFGPGDTEAWFHVRQFALPEGSRAGCGGADIRFEEK